MLKSNDFIHQSHIALSEIQSPLQEPFLRQLEAVVYHPADSISFASGKPNCKPTSFPCGRSCQPAKTKGGKATQCRNLLQGQAKTHADWLKMQATSLAPNTTASPKQVKAVLPTVSASPIKTNDIELSSKRNELINRVGKKTVEDAEKNVQRILADKDTNVYIRIGSSDTLEKVLGSSFKTSAELGIDTHQIPNLKGGYQQARNRVEAKSLGYDEKGTKPSDRPIYGYIGGKDLNGVSHADVQAYGSIAVKLKSEAKDRSTFTGCDSFKSGIASPMVNPGNPPPPNAASLASMTRHGYDLDKLPSHYPSFMSDTSGQKGQIQSAAKAKTIDDLAPKLAPTGNRYMEAQVHGGVKPEDIAELHFSPKGATDRPTAAIAAWAKANGVKIYTDGKEEDLDKIINPPKKTKVQEINEAIDKGDFQSVMDYADDVDKRAKVKSKNGGRADHQLGVLYEDAGYDKAPKVVSEQDITDEWKKNGGTLMIRGVGAGPNSRTQFLDEFKSGTYHPGFGIYGNGTYVSHAGQPPNDATAEDAWNAIGKRNSYITSYGVTMRMALPKDVNIISQSKIGKEATKVQKDMDAWANRERAKIKATAVAPVTPISQSDQVRVDTEVARIRADYKASYKPRASVRFQYGANSLSDGSLSFGHKVVVPSLDKKARPDQDTGVILHERFGSYKGDQFAISDKDGNIISEHKTKAQASKAAVDHFINESAHKAAGVKKPTAALTPTKAIADFDAKYNRMKDVMFGDIGGSNCSGRFAVIRGYDAIQLNKSYEPKRFMNLLNRSKVMIQSNELDYKTGLFKVAG